jgi:hypothetical protein
MKRLACFALVSAFAIGGCSYQVQTASAPQFDVYSHYSTKVAGRWALIVDPGAYQASVYPEGITCRVDAYHIDLTSSFKEEATGTFRNTATEVDIHDRPLSAQDLASLGYSGEVEITGNDFHHRLSFSRGFFLANPEADVSLDASLVATGSNGTLLRTSATGTGEGSTDGWIGCGRGSAALSQAAQAAMKDLLAKLAERFSNAPQVRSAAIANATP